jgi:hypothetical protein
VISPPSAVARIQTVFDDAVANKATVTQMVAAMRKAVQGAAM